MMGMWRRTATEIGLLSSLTSLASTETTEVGVGSASASASAGELLIGEIVVIVGVQVGVHVW
jgi:hypothetical protein